LITHPHTRKSAVTVLPSDTLKAAYRKMKMYDVSQLPVMEDGKLLGIVSETDLLLAVHGNKDGFAKKVSDAMAKNLVTFQVSQSIEELPAIFERGMVAIIMDKDTFLGLITPIDFLQYLRKRMGQI
jgi:cystathionine beta-synthase